MSSFSLRLDSHIRLDLLNQRLCFGQDSIKSVVRRFQYHLLAQEVDGYISDTVNLLYGVLDFVSTVSAVKVDQFNGLFHGDSPLSFLIFGWFDMTEQLKDCLIVHAVSIFTKPFKVNGFGNGSALWIGKPADWICHENHFLFG